MTEDTKLTHQDGIGGEDESRETRLVVDLDER